jgi:hypothetical protein
VQSWPFRRGHRSGRVFAGAVEAGWRPPSFFSDDDDRARDALIARLVRRATAVSLVAHRAGEGEAHVFFDVTAPAARPRPIFACVVLSRARCAQLVASGQPVVERCDMQVSDADALDEPALRRAMRQWMKRSFPCATLPRSVRVQVVGA